MDNNTTVRVVESIMQSVKETISAEGCIIPDGPLTSLKDVLYWMIRTEAWNDH